MKSRGEFVRWGNLSPQKHDISGDRGFHTPPVSWGFYAFPRGFIEPFLLTGFGEGSLQNGRYRKLRDPQGKVYKFRYDSKHTWRDNFPKKLWKRLHLNIPEFDDTDLDPMEDEEKYMSEEDKYWEEVKKGGPYEVWIENSPKHFTYGGLIWHHLFSIDSPESDKEFSGYLKFSGSWVLTDMPTYLKCLSREWGKGKFSGAFKLSEEKKKAPGFNYGGGKYPFSKDHFEVYIESIQKDNKR